MNDKKGQSLFLRLRPELDALTDDELTRFACSVMKYALVKTSSAELPGDQKAIHMRRFTDLCDSLAEEIKTWPADIAAFSARVRTQS